MRSSQWSKFNEGTDEEEIDLNKDAEYERRKIRLYNKIVNVNKKGEDIFDNNTSFGVMDGIVDSGSSSELNNTIDNYTEDEINQITAKYESYLSFKINDKGVRSSEYIMECQSKEIERLTRLSNGYCNEIVSMNKTNQLLKLELEDLKGKEQNRQKLIQNMEESIMQSHLDPTLIESIFKKIQDTTRHAELLSKAFIGLAASIVFNKHYSKVDRRQMVIDYLRPCRSVDQNVNALYEAIYFMKESRGTIITTARRRDAEKVYSEKMEDELVAVLSSSSDESFDCEAPVPVVFEEYELKRLNINKT